MSLQTELEVLEDLMFAARACVEGARRALAETEPDGSETIQAVLRDRCDLLLDVSYAMVVRDVPADEIAQRLATAARAAASAELTSADRSLRHELVRSLAQPRLAPPLRALLERHLAVIEDPRGSPMPPRPNRRGTALGSLVIPTPCAHPLRNYPGVASASRA